MARGIVSQVYLSILQFYALDLKFSFKKAPIGNLGIKRAGIDQGIAIAVGHVEAPHVYVPE